MNRKNMYRKCLIVGIVLNLMLLFGYLYTHEDLIKEKTVAAAAAESVEEKYLMPVGEPVGIYIQTHGLLVLGTGTVINTQGEKTEPSKGLVEPGDYILQINGMDMENIDDFVAVLNQSNGESVILQLEREGIPLEQTVLPVETIGGQYMLGIWLRDDAQGIGTLSFVDENNQFVALGHGITDIDTGKLIEIQDGALFCAKVLSLVKGKSGKAGEMIGNICYDQAKQLGVITENTSRGIVGEMQIADYQFDPERALPVGKQEEVHIGEASVMADVDGTVQEYTAAIEQIYRNRREGGKNIVVKIVDEELLEKTNGIIQGMSGSPIIQDGKIIGAVTHVFVNDPAKGYGIFIENMLE